MDLSIGVFGNIGKIGDEMVCLPAYYVLKCLYPNSHLTLISNSNNAKNLFANLEFIDDIISFDTYKDSRGV